MMIKRILNYIGVNLFNFFTILWNISLNIWNEIRNGVTYVFIGVIIPILISVISFKWACFVGPEEPNQPIDVTIVVFITLCMIFYMVVMLLAYIDFCKEEKKA